MTDLCWVKKNYEHFKEFLCVVYLLSITSYKNIGVLKRSPKVLIYLIYVYVNCICKAKHDLEMVNFFIKHGYFSNTENKTIPTWKCTYQALIFAKSLSILEASLLK